MMNWRFLIVVLAGILGGCADSWDKSSPETPPGGLGISVNGNIEAGPENVAAVSQLPSANHVGPVSPFGTKGTEQAYEFRSGYRLGAGDRLAIRVAGEADITGEYIVDASGNISLPYIQTLSVAGLNVVEVEQQITTKLRIGYLRDPKVSVQSTSLRPFYILGEVNASGSFAYQPGITAQNAVAIAGGYSARAHHGDVLITRKNDRGTLTTKAPITTQIYPGDIIFIRERWF